jgi:hypothetical protein
VDQNNVRTSRELFSQMKEEGWNVDVGTINNSLMVAEHISWFHSTIGKYSDTMFVQLWTHAFIVSLSRQIVPSK